MAIKKFNSVDGFSVGSDTLIAVIDSVANVSANSLNVSNQSNLGNVGNITITGGSSGYVLQTDGAGNLTFVNPASTGIAGSNTQVQFNNNSSFGASANFTFNIATNTLTSNYYSGVLTTSSQPNITSIGSLVGLTVSNNTGLVDFYNTANVNLGNISNLHIAGGSAGYVLKTDGSGNLSWGIDTTAAGGSNRDVQFNDGGSLSGNSNFTFDKATSILTLTGNLITTNANLGNLASANYFSGNGSLLSSITGSNVSGNVAYAITSNYANTANSVSGSNVSGNVAYAITSNYANTANSVAGANVTGQVGNALVAGTVYSNVQSNIESLGNLVGLTVSNVYGLVDFITTANVSLGSINNLHITGGTAGYVLTTDGYGDLSWEPGGSGTGFVSIRKDNFVGNGVQTSFPLSSLPSGEDAVEVNLNGLIQQGYVYDIVGSNVVFSTAPVNGANIEITTFGALAINQTDAQILFIDGSNLTGSNNFTFISANNTLLVNNVSSSANVTAGNIKSDNLLYANGSPYIFTTSAAGANTQVQFNDSNSFAGSANFTFNKTTNTLAVTNIVSNGSGITYITGSNVFGNVSSAVQSHYSNIANSVDGSNVSGNVSYAITSNYANTANSISGSNVSGNVAEAVHAYYADTANSVSGSNVNGNVNYAITSNYANTANSISGSNVNGNVSWAITSNYANTANSINGSNVSGNVADAVHAYYADTANSIAGANVNGNVNWAITSNYANTANSVAGANVTGQVSNALIAGTVYTNSQPNITSVGTLLGVTVSGNIDVTGNINVTGNLNYSNVSDLVVGDPLIYIGANNTGNLYDLGIVASYNDGNYYHTGIARDATDGVWKLFDHVVAEPTTTIDFANATYADFKSGNIVANGNITGNNANLGNLVIANYFVGDGSLLTNLNSANIGNVANANYANYAGTAYSVSGSNVSGNVNYAITSNYANTANSISGSNVSGNVAYAITSNYANTANSISGSNVSGNVDYAVTSNWANVANSISGSNVSGNVTDAVHAYYADVANSVVGSNVSGNVNWAITSNYANTANSVAGANVTGQVSNALIAGTVYTNAQPNITSVGTLTGLNVSGNTTIIGNLTVSGNIEYINVSSLQIEDPIIELGGGANGAPLTSNDGKDRGTLLHYYTTNTVDAFMGWDNSNGEFAFGSNVTVSNEVVTYNNFGNIRAGYYIGDGSLLSNINAANIVGSYSNTNVAAYLPTYTGNVSANYFIGNGSTLTYITGSNVNGNVTSSIQAHYANIANSVSGSNVSGNVADAVHAYYADTANSVAGANVTGQVSNALVAGTVYTNAQPNITSVGTLANLSVTGNVTAGNAVIGSGSGGNITGANLVSANYFSGDGSLLTNINGANVSNVANANYANYAGTAYAVSGSNVSGNVADAVHAYYADTANSVAGANVTGQVSNALISGTVYTNSQPNITSLGTLTDLTVNGLTDLGSVSNITITGGTTGYVLTTNGAGDLSWQAAGGSTGPGFVNITKNSFTGNGVQTIFTLTTTPASEASLLVNIDGITQQDAAYSLAGANVTFASAPLNGEVVEIVSYGSIAIGSNATVLFNDNGDIGNIAAFNFNKSSNTLSVINIDTSSISFDSGVITVAGTNAGIFSSGIDNINLGLSANVTIGSSSGNTTIQGNLISGNISTSSNLSILGTATITNLKVNDLYSNRTPVSVTTNTVVDSFSVNKYRSAKYTMRVNSDDGYQAVEVLLIHDGSDSYVTIYGSLSTIGTDIVTLTSNINSGNVRLLATTGSANTTVNLVGTYVAD